MHVPPTPHHGPKRAATDFIIIHYTEITPLKAVTDLFLDPESNVSCHMIIDVDGTQHPWIPEDLIAWHAGESAWQEHRGLNKNALGIELVYTPKGSQDFPKAQIKALEQVLADWMKRFQVPSTYILGHSDIAPLRKKDPGPMFPWNVLAQKGWGPIAPHLSPPLPSLPDYMPSEEETYTWLTKIGYVVPREYTDEALWSFACHLPTSLRASPAQIHACLKHVSTFF